MQALESHVTKEVQEMTLQLQKNSQDIKQEISRVIDDPWDQKPIRFQDAVGRKYPMPLEVCATYDVRFVIREGNIYSNSATGPFRLPWTCFQRDVDFRSNQIRLVLAF